MSIDLRLGAWQTALADVESVDCLIVDAPYSERTHGAYREMEEVNRRAIKYAAWSADDVAEFVASWAPRTAGWFVTITDHVLAPIWERELATTGRYVFAPLACVEPGRSVRLSGDGPSQWSCWAIVARPKTRSMQKWGALPGVYIVPEGKARRNGNGQPRHSVVGGKPFWLMRAIVRDYSRLGDLVCDPCAGGATTLRAAALEGRRAIGSELDPNTYALAQRLCARFPVDATGKQGGLFDAPPDSEQAAG